MGSCYLLIIFKVNLAKYHQNEREECSVRILLAEDERSLSRAVTALLERNHYAVDAVYDGREALDYLESGNYDALILDIMMPRMDGMEVLRHLRQQGSSVPVLMLTAKGEVEDKVLGLDSGANPRQIIPTERFLERIWGYDSEVEISVVWVYISYLRKKLIALQADVEIRVSRNIGYALEVRT